MENLNKLTKLLGADRIMTADDIQQILLGIMEILKSYKEGTESINEETKQVVNSLLEHTVKYNQETISDFKSEAEKAHGERMKELQDFLSEVKVTLGDMEVMMSEVKDGKDADEERVIEEVISRIKIDPTVVTVTAEEIRDRLASLKDEDRLDKSAIKGLDKVIQQKDLDYAIATLQQQASFLINKGGLKTVSHDVSLSGDGTPESPLAVVSSSGLTLQTDGVANGSQTLLNLVGGTNVTLTDNGTGSVTIAATGGSGSGDVVGPASATDNAIARFDSTTGKLIQNSGVTVSDTNIITSAGNIDSSLTASEIVGTNGSKQLVSLAVATYPSLTELAHVKGVTSAIQTQINAKQATLVSGTNIKTVGGGTLLGAGDLGQISSSYIDVPQDGGSPTLSTLTEYITAVGSTGVSDGTITYVTVGTAANKISVAGGEGFIRTTNDQQGSLVACKWPASTDLATLANPAVGFETTIFVGIEYSAGSVTAVTKSALTDFNWYTNFPLARCAWDGTELYIVNAYAHAEDTANHTRQYLRKVFGFTRENAPEGSGGLELSVSLRALAMTAGKVWLGFNNYQFAAITSGTAFNTYYRRAGGGFVETTGVTNFPNTQYDDGSGTLQNLTGSRYGTLWVYASVGDTKLHCVYGAVNATSVANAQLDAAPSLPDHLTYGGILIARIIFQKSGSTSTLVESAWANAFTGSSVGDHSLLTNLQGGTASEYYHLTSAEYTGTGTGNFVRTTSPTLVTPTLTTPVINGATLNGDLQIDATPNTDDTWNGKSTNTFNAAATIAQFDCVYLTSSSTWALTDADAIGTAGNVLIMMAGEAGTASNPLRVIEPGSWVRNDAWNWTVGGALYLDTATSGGLTQTAPSGADDVVKVVGYAASADVIYFAPSVNWIIHT